MKMKLFGIKMLLSFSERKAKHSNQEHDANRQNTQDEASCCVAVSQEWDQKPRHHQKRPVHQYPGGTSNSLLKKSILGPIGSSNRTIWPQKYCQENEIMV